MRAFLARRTGVAAAQTALDDATHALSAGAAGADGTYQVALERWLALGAADLDERARASPATFGSPLTRRWSRSRAARRPGSVWPRCCWPGSTCSCSTSRPTISTCAGLDRLETFVGDAARRAPSWSATIASSSPVRSPGWSSSTSPSSRSARSAGAMPPTSRSASIARAHERDGVRGVRRTPARLLEARAREQRSWMDKGVRNARRKATDNDKIGRRFRAEATREAGGQGASDRAPHRAARRGGGAAQGVAAADDDRGRARGRVR